MADDDRSGPENPDDQNPFKGTPFEQLFGQLGGAFGGGPGGPGGGDPANGMWGLFGRAGGQPGTGGPTPPGGMPDLGALLGSFGRFLQPHEGPVNWELALDVARRTAAQRPDPAPTDNQKSAVADAVRLADLWLDAATHFSSGVTTTAAWSRAEWIVHTTDVWKRLVEPVAAKAVGSLGDALPEEARAMAGPLLGILSQATGAMVASQVGSALGGLAGEVLTASDVGLPLGPEGCAALVPANVEEFREGLEASTTDVHLFLALREAAHQRLFANVPWLREHLVGAVRDYAEGIELDVSGLEEQVRGLDPTNLQAMQEAVEGGLFDLKRTPQQEAALQRLETTLALVEGWVDEVVGQATAEKMPAAAALQEAVRRRRAAGGPAEQTFASLVGLELRPRRLRDASTLWGSLRTRQGAEARDGVWMHPDLLPTAADLDDPLGFREGATAPQDLSEDEFDAELRKLLGDGPDTAGAPDAEQG